jgi:basic membrane protein A
VLAALLAGLLAVVGCARDTGTGGAAGGECKRNQAPAASAPTGPTAAQGAKPNASALKVGLAYDIGGRGDASFNDSAAAGLDLAKAELGLTQVKELSAAAGESEADKATRLRQLASEGYNPIIAVGFAYQPSVSTVAKELPNVQFGLVDAAVEGASNVTPLVFAEEQGSFLVGAAAAYKTTACHIGFVGGVEVPLIKKFEAGYIQGAKAVAPDIQITSRYLTPAGDFTGFQDPAKGNVAAKGELDAGADIIYHAAGLSGNGVFEAVNAANTQQNPKWGIGVDSDQYNAPALAGVKNIILTSMLKRVDVATYDYIAAVAGNTVPALPKVFDLKADGVGYAKSGGFVDDITAQLQGYRDAIISGQITVGTTP